MVDKIIGKSQANENIANPASLKKRALHIFIEMAYLIPLSIILTLYGCESCIVIVYGGLAILSELIFERSIPHFITNTRIVISVEDKYIWHRFPKADPNHHIMIKVLPLTLDLVMRFKMIFFRFWMKSMTVAFIFILIFPILYYKITPHDYLTGTRVVDNKED